MGYLDPLEPEIVARRFAENDSRTSAKAGREENVILKGSGAMSKEAMLYEKRAENEVHCRLCNHTCTIAPGKFGLCRVRENRDGTLYSRVYGEAIAANADPIEKKPLYHFLPGTLSFSVATRGCNFQCGFCQNWQISQTTTDGGGHRVTTHLEPPELVRLARSQTCHGIAYTYTEPTIYFEYAYDTAKLAHEAGLKNVFVTNGFMTDEAVRTIQPYLDAANVDLKSFSDDFYRKTCRGKLQPVLDTIRLMRELGIWVEVTTLIVPGQNDSVPELSDIAGFLAEVDADIPWHISRFHPDYQFADGDVTPVSTMERAREIGREKGLRYIYMGNVPDASRDTVCPECGETVIRRHYMAATENFVKNGACTGCGAAIPGVFDHPPV